MSEFSFGERAIDSPSLRVEIQPLLRLVYMWMGFGLLVTSFVAVLVASSSALTDMLFSSPILLIEC